MASTDVFEKLKLAKHLVYVKDAEGSTMRMGEIVLNGSIIQHLPEFPSVDTVLNDIQEFPSRKDDIWLLDFAKSGTNWMVSIIELLMNKQCDSVVKNKAQAMLELCPDLKLFETIPSPRVLNTHIRLPLLPAKLFENNKVIVVLRNPKSVAVSLYYHLTKLPFYDYSGTFSGYLPHFMKGHCPEIFGNWFDYVFEVWEAFKNKPNVLFVFYEELKKDPVKIILEVSRFLELDHNVSFIEEVAKQTSIETLKKRQNETDKEFTPITKVMFREGTITDWKTHFTVAQNEMFDAVYEEKMKHYPDLKERIQFC